MSDDKNESGAYINNPEFPYKNLNIDKIEKIRRTGSLNTQSSSEKKQNNDDTNNNGSVPKQSGLRSLGNTLSKKLSMSKNFIERNIEKIAILSKKNDKNAQKNKTNNRNNTANFETQKDWKKDTKDIKNNSLNSGMLKNKNASNSTGTSKASTAQIGDNIIASNNRNNNNQNNSSHRNTNLSDMNKNENVLNKGQNKNIENDIVKINNFHNNTFYNTNLMEVKNYEISKKSQKTSDKCSKEYSYYDFERPKNIVKNFNPNYEDNDNNIFHKKQKAVLNEETTNKNYKNKIMNNMMGKEGDEDQRKTTLSLLKQSGSNDIPKFSTSGRTSSQNDFRENNDAGKGKHSSIRISDNTDINGETSVYYKSKGGSLYQNMDQEEMIIKMKENLKLTGSNESFPMKNIVRTKSEQDKLKIYSGLVKKERNTYNEKYSIYNMDTRSSNRNTDYGSYNISIYENKGRSTTKNENIYGKDSRTDSIYSNIGKVKSERCDDHEEEKRRNDYEINQRNHNNQKDNNTDNEKISLNIPMSHNDSNTYSSIIIRKKKTSSVENPINLDDSFVDNLTNYSSNNNKEYELENGNKKKDGPKNIRSISNMGSEFYSEKSKHIENFRESKVKKEKPYFYNTDNQKDNFQGLEKNSDNGDVVAISDNEMERNSHFKRAGDRTRGNEIDRKKYSENINEKISYNNIESNSTAPKYGDKSNEHTSYEHEKVCEDQTKERYKNIEDINIHNVSKLLNFSNMSSNKKPKINDGNLSNDKGKVFYEDLSKYNETPNDHNNKAKYIKTEIKEDQENNNNDYDDDYLNSNYYAVSSSRKADPGFSDACVTPSCENNFEGELQNDKMEKDYKNKEEKTRIIEKINEANDENDRENHDEDRVSNNPEKNNYYKLEINTNELNNKNEGNSNFLHSSNDSYNPNMANIYSRISNDANTKKNNKLVNKNLIMKELFGSNYESSLKNNLNESSNILNESSCAGWSEEGKALEGENHDTAEKKVVEDEDTQIYALEGENEINKGVEDKRDENEKEENKITRKEGHQMHEYIEEINDENDNKYGGSLNNDKSIINESEEMENRFHLKKNGNNIKDMFDMGLENDEDSLLKRYEENASPRILSKPNFNNRTSESSYYKSDIMNQSKKMSLNSRSGISFMGKERIDEISYCENGQRENFQDSSNKYNMNKEYISNKGSHDITKSSIEMEAYRNMSNNCNDENGEYTDNFGTDGDADQFYDVETEKENISKRVQNNIIDRRNVLSNQIVRRSEGQGHNEEILKHDEKNSTNYTYSDYIKRGGNHYYKLFERNKVNNYEEKTENERVNDRTDFNENENNKTNNLHGKSKLSKYIDNKFLIYKNNLFNNTNESNLERDMMYRSGDKNGNINEDYVDDEKKHLIDYPSNNSSYIMEKRKSTDNTGTLLNRDNLENQNKMMQNFDMKSSISDDYYLDYIKRQGYNEKNRIECDNGERSCDEKYMEHNNNVDEKDKMHMNNKKKRKSNHEERILTYNTKNRIEYDNHSNSGDFFDGMERCEKKKKKSMSNNAENINSINDDNSVNMMENLNSLENMSNTNNLNSMENMSNPNNLNSLENMSNPNNLNSMNNLNSSLSYRRSECSKVEFYSSINETRTSSQTIVSKRSKYALKQSNASSMLDEIPTLFNFVNCCSIILGSEIIYVTDETYGKCENILKDKPFHSNVERGYYEFCSNDLYNVLDDKLKSNVGKGNAHGNPKTGEKEKKNSHSYYNASQKCDDYNFDEKSDFSIGKNEESNEFSQFEEVPKSRECPGWLTKRRIKKYFDFCIVKLCKPTLIKGIDIDTNNFLGNYAPYVSIEGAYIEDDDLMSSEAFSKYVEKIKIENKIKRDKRRANGIRRNTSNDAKNGSCDDDTFSYYKEKEKNGINDMSMDRNNPFSDGEGKRERRQDVKHKKRSLSNERGSRWSDKGSENNLSRSKEEIEIMINGKRYFQRNKYFYEPILIDPTDKSSEEYENYVEIIKYNESLKQLNDGNMKPTSFVANGNEYRCIENKLYTLIDVTREIASKYPDIHNKALVKKVSNNAQNTNELNGEYSSESVHKCVDQASNDFYKGKIEDSDDDELYNDILDGYSCNTLYLDNDYSVEKRIYNTLHKKYQWVSILEDERMNPGFKNYNHNCFNINTCNKIFTHLIVCLLPDGGINKLRVYGEIKISKNVKQKNYKKIINVSNILDGSNVVYTTDEFYGKSDNILIDQNSKYVMGWQTRRLINRPLRYVDNLQLNNISSIFYNNNYCIIKLSYIANVKYIEINTIFYEYNFPLCVSIDHCYISDIHGEEKSKQMKYFSDNIHNIEWKELLPLSYIKGNHINYFTINPADFNDESSNLLPSSHLRLNIYPDGGINTIKVFGTVLEV